MKGFCPASSHLEKKGGLQILKAKVSPPEVAGVRIPAEVMNMKGEAEETCWLPSACFSFKHCLEGK